MAIIDLVQCNAPPTICAWKFGSDQLSNWTQLIVNETQEAFLVHGGVYEGPFGAGRHTLTTENIPLLSRLMGLPFGGKTPFIAEVWYVNRISKLDVTWGTPDPIQLVDPRYNLMVPVRAFGQYGLRINDSKKFLLKLVGTQPDFTTDGLSRYFRGAFITRIKTEIAAVILNRGLSVLEIAPHLATLSEQLQAVLSPVMDDYGVELLNFALESVNVPENDPAVASLKQSLAKRADMGILGYDYRQQRSFDVLAAAASNEGSAGQVAGLGIGVGVGAGIAGPMGNLMGQVVQQAAPAIAEPQAPASAGPKGVTPEDKIRLLRELAALHKDGILSDEEFQAEKHKLLS